MTLRFRYSWGYTTTEGTIMAEEFTDEQTFPICVECGNPVLPWQSAHIAKDRPEFHWMDDGKIRHGDCRTRQGLYADRGAVAALRWVASIGTMPGMSWPETLQYHADNKSHWEVTDDGQTR